MQIYLYECTNQIVKDLSKRIVMFLSSSSVSLAVFHYSTDLTGKGHELNMMIALS